MQELTNELLEIYEPLFYPSTYRDPLRALRAITKMTKNKEGNYILSGEIKRLFHTMDAKRLFRMITQDTKNEMVIEELEKLLEEETLLSDDYDWKKESAPKISRLLADIYLHHIIDIWFEDEIKEHCQGTCELIRYRHEFECSFALKEDIQLFTDKLLQRLQLYGLRLDAQRTIIMRQEQS